MLVLNLPFKALMFLTLMRPSLVLFLVLWLKLVKDFLKVRCRLALLPRFIVFDTLTLADDRLEAFYDNPNALRDYFRDIGRMVLAAEGRKANDSHADCYQYFCVPEYGTA